MLWDFDRLKGAALVAPVINYWWPSLPSNLATEAYYKQPVGDQWALRVAHYMPWLTYWWNTQKFFPSSSVIARNPDVFSTQDLEILNKKSSVIDPEREKQKVLGQNLKLLYTNPNFFILIDIELEIKFQQKDILIFSCVKIMMTHTWTEIFA